MPQQGRSRRVAAQQTQAGQRKKRRSRGPSGIPSATHTPQAQDEAGPLPAIEAVQDASRPQAAELPRRTPTRPAEPRAALYAYVRPELTRIFGLTAGVLATLIGLSFVLK